MTLRDLTETEVKRLTAQYKNCWQNFLHRHPSIAKRLEENAHEQVLCEQVAQAMFSDGLKAFLAVQPLRKNEALPEIP